MEKGRLTLKTMSKLLTEDDMKIIQTKFGCAKRPDHLVACSAPAVHASYWGKRLTSILPTVYQAAMLDGCWEGIGRGN